MLTEQPPVTKNKVSANVSATRAATGLVVVELPKNRVGVWVVELEPRPNGVLKWVALERFDLYNDREGQTAALARFVDALPDGRAVLMCITDTALAKTRPLGQELYEILHRLGAPKAMPPIGYRFPFAMIGAKGMRSGEALCAVDKTKARVSSRCSCCSCALCPVTVAPRLV